MSDFPGPVTTPLFVNTMMMNSAASACRMSGSGFVTGGAVTWVANLAIYVPVLLPWAYPVNRVFWINGSTVTSSNADFGIYTIDGTKIYSTGSVAMSGTSAPQFVTPGTPFVLPAGAYYFAWACNNTTNRGYGNAVTAVTGRQSGVVQQASAFALPATATFATLSNALFPFCGITRTSSGF